MVRRATALVLLGVGCLVGPACGGSSEPTAPRPAAEPFAQPPASSAPCDDDTRRRLEAQVRAQIQSELRGRNGIVYGQPNSGCATLTVPPSGTPRP